MKARKINCALKGDCRDTHSSVSRTASRPSKGSPEAEDAGCGAQANKRTRLASFDPIKMGEAELQQVTDAMYALMKQGGQKYPSKLGRRDAIRRHCIDCCGSDLSELRRCEAISCSLWPFRLGADPYRKNTKRNNPASDNSTRARK